MIIEKLDKLASQLESSGIIHLASLLDIVANTIEKSSDPDARVIEAFGPNGRYALFCDMDGVLADFEKGYLSKAPDLPPIGTPLDGRIAGVSKFWEDLDFQPGGERLWGFIRHLNPTLLTAPPSCYPKGSPEQVEVEKQTGIGKRNWAQKKLGVPESRVILERNKWLKMAPGKISVLIDDGMHNIGPWGEKGGIPVHHDTTDGTGVVVDEGKLAVEGTISKLKELATGAKEGAQ